MQLEQRKKEEKAEQVKEKEKTPTEDTDPVQQATGLESLERR